MDVWLDRVSSETEAAIAGMGVAQLENAPAGKWSSANILEHLAKAFGGTAKVMEEQLAAGAGPASRAATWKERLSVFVLTRLDYFPNGRKAPAFVIPEGVDAESALRSFRENLARMDRAIAAAEQRWGAGIDIAVHPILGPMTAFEWRKFHYLHSHHHAKQLRALKAMSR
jgi:hypothetical protein